MIEIDVSKISKKDRYKLASGSVIPRPIALVSTISKDGIPNLAPFSFFTIASYSPFILVFFPLNYKKGFELKDTVKNILATNEFVIHIVDESLASPVNVASGIYPFDENEFDISGLTPIPSIKVKPFRVKESKIHFECILFGSLEIGKGEGGSNAIFGEVVLAHVEESLIDNFKIDAKKLAPVSRLAGANWSKLGEIFTLERPVVE